VGHQGLSQHRWLHVNPSLLLETYCLQFTVYSTHPRGVGLKELQRASYHETVGVGVSQGWLCALGAAGW
jgi:hypothetical protein